MKKILCLISLLGMVGCNDVRKETVAKKAVSLKENNVSAFSSLNSYSTHPDTFALFFYPTAEELITRQSPLYSDSDSTEIKLSKIITNVLRLSYKRDALDKQIYAIENLKRPINDQMTEAKCDEDPTTDICMELDDQLTAIDNQYTPMVYVNQSSAHLLGIQESLDKDITKPINWQKYGADAKLYEFDINELTNEVSIKMPSLGPYENRYTTKDGDIVNVVYRSSEFNDDIKLLTFILLEKGEFKQPTGYIYEFKLEKSFYLNKIRFKGTVIKRLNGDEVQSGICKFELPIDEQKIKNLK